MSRSDQNADINADLLDGLTGVANRSGWLQAAESVLSKDTEPKIVLYIDLDRFKFVNDSLGHQAGDTVLKQAVSVIQKAVNSQLDIIGRLGGDEFVALLSAPESIEQSERIANQMVSQISKPILIDQTEVEIGASIGVAHFPRDSHNLEQLLKFADLAMYRAKHSGRNQVVSFHQQMIKQIEYRRSVQMQLRKALHEELLEANYLPTYNTQSGEAVSVELTVNCNQLDLLSNIDQAELFSIIDDSQVAILLSEWMFSQGLSFLQKIQEKGLELDLVIPVRPSHFHQNGFVDWLSEEIEDYQVVPENVVIKLNDYCLNVQRFPVEKQLQTLNLLGVEVAVHNYGTGQISPLKLHDWPINQLNLSSVFVQEANSKRSIASMTEALIKMGYMLNKRVVAYGVSSIEQYDFLNSHQCYLMQGPYLAEPMSESDFELDQLNVNHELEDSLLSKLDDMDDY